MNGGVHEPLGVNLAFGDGLVHVLLPDQRFSQLDLPASLTHQ